MTKKKILFLIGSILLCQMAGIIGTFFTTSSIPVWYDTLQKPFFNPPSWLFGPVWVLLYTLMGISLFLIWAEKNKPDKKAAFIFFFIQLFLNASWSPIFFGLRSPFWAFIVITFLWFSILLTLINFYKISKLAAGLLIPYFLWVSFAAVLNFSLWQLNL